METREKNISKILREQVFVHFSETLSNIFNNIPDSILDSIEEIRFRSNKPIIITGGFGELFLNGDGIAGILNNLYHITPQEIFEIFGSMCENSIYAVQEELRNGFITIKGGHRIGLTGQVVLEEKRIKNIKHLSGLNIRISRQIKGVADNLISHLIFDNSIFHTLIISPPQCGKTTLIRDIARQISSGIKRYNFNGIKVGIVDERSEIAACYKGVPQNDVGIRTDVLDCCPKSKGMIMLLRSMSPQVIVTDELGSAEDKDAVIQVINAGIKLITSIHGSCIEEVSIRPEISEIFEKNFFERIIVLSNRNGPGTIEEIIDGKSKQNLLLGGSDAI